MKLPTFALIALSGLLAGCATETPTYDTRKDRLMWDYRAAATAMRQGHFERARTLLDGAMAELDAAPAHEERDALRRPSEKFFLGESFERVMARYYRAMIFWMEGRLEDAQHAFHAAQATDAVSSPSGRADYVLLDYLDGYTVAKRGGNGGELLRHAESRSAVKPLPAYDPKANVMVFAEFGRAPTKVVTGQPGVPVRFAPAKVEAVAAEITFGNTTVRLPALDDLNRQARATSSDTRAWNNLPQYLGFGALRLPPGRHEGSVRFLDAAGQELTQLRKVVSVNAYAQRDTVVFVSDQNQ